MALSDWVVLLKKWAKEDETLWCWAGRITKMFGETFLLTRDVEMAICIVLLRLGFSYLYSFFRQRFLR